jgi:hypothetical protein
LHLFAEAPGPRVGDPAWDFEPDKVVIKKGTVLEIDDQGGEPHTFTEVKTFGGGFIDALNGGEHEAPNAREVSRISRSPAPEFSSAATGSSA